jgi:serine O-acetyltransferase
MKRSRIERFIARTRWPIVGRFFYFFNVLVGFDIPPSVAIGRQFRLEHFGLGVVVHPATEIGDRVYIYSGVTIGRADAYRREGSDFEKIVIEDDVILGTGCKVLCKEGILRVGKGTVIGANAVLLQSTGENEIWAGIPAKRVGMRDPASLQEMQFAVMLPMSMCI